MCRNTIRSIFLKMEVCEKGEIFCLHLAYTLRFTFRVRDGLSVIRKLGAQVSFHQFIAYSLFTLVVTKNSTAYQLLLQIIVRPASSSNASVHYGEIIKNPIVTKTIQGRLVSLFEPVRRRCNATVERRETIAPPTIVKKIKKRKRRLCRQSVFRFTRSDFDEA